MRFRRLPAACLAAALLAAAAPQWALADDFAGTWTLTIDTPRGEQNPTLVVEKNGDGYSGVYNSLRGPIDVETIERNGSSFSFPLVISVPIGDVEVNYVGTFEGNDMTGTVQSPRGEVPFTAVRSAD